jgi:hypothetical protein
MLADACAICVDTSAPAEIGRQHAPPARAASMHGTDPDPSAAAPRAAIIPARRTCSAPTAARRTSASWSRSAVCTTPIDCGPRYGGSSDSAVARAIAGCAVSFTSAGSALAACAAAFRPACRAAA